MLMQDGVLVIAGASKGLGRELALKAAENKFPVALISRNLTELQQLRDSLLEKIGPQNITVHAGDLADAQKTYKIFDDIVGHHKKIRALVNCAGTWTGGQSVRQLNFDAMHLSIMQNFFVAFNTIKAMLEQSDEAICKPAAIINIGATASLRGARNCSAFAVAKGALRQLSQSLARELGPEKIHVSHMIIDGLIANERTKKLNINTDKNKFIDLNALANSILNVIQQEPSCWTFEWDIRPFNESW